MRTISLEIPQPSITKTSLKITSLKFLSNLLGANELNIEYQDSSSSNGPQGDRPYWLSVLHIMHIDGFMWMRNEFTDKAVEFHHICFNPLIFDVHCYSWLADLHIKCLRADSRLAPSQWEMALLCNDVSHWLGAHLESVLCLVKPQSVKILNRLLDFMQRSLS